MPTVVARFAGLLLILLLLASVTGSADGPEDEAEFHYLHGFEASGEFEGRCDVAGFRFDTDSPGRVWIEADSISLILYQTWRNSTLLDLDGVYRHESVVTVQRLETPIHRLEGPVRFDWNPGAHLFLTQDYYVEHPNPLGESAGLSADLHANELVSGAPKGILSAGPGAYYAEHNGSLIRFDSGISGPARWLSTDQDEIRITGDAFLLFDTLAISGDGFQHDLPTYRQVHREAETAVSYLQSIKHTHGLAFVENLDMHIDPDPGALACGTLDWSGSGSTTYRMSSGSVTHANGTHDFENQQFTMDGVFASQEEIRKFPAPWGEENRIETRAQGDFSSGADYVPITSSNGLEWSTTTQLTLVALMAALAAAVWKLGPVISALFTRVEKGEALEHPLRLLVYGSAHQHPGTTLVELVQRTGNAYSTIQHHTGLLVRLELVQTHRFGRQVHLFPPGTPRNKARQIVCLRQEPVQHLVGLINGDRRRMREVRAILQKDFQRGASWATRIVNQAERAGLIEREKTEKGVMLCAKES